ncbi:MAG TPA: hypothetical protein VFB62_09875, partial [Polyangiaceae bacterium]|nr:hypothetical protein [Polyangiaceae bacterium]
EKALYAHAEMVGGVRLKLTPRTVATTVGGPLTLLVGGTLLRASRSISIKSLHASITAGALFRLKSDGPITIRGDQLLLRSKSSLRMSVGDTAIAMSSDTLAIEGDMLTDSPVVEVSGESVNVTKG